MWKYNGYGTSWTDVGPSGVTVGSLSAVGQQLWMAGPTATYQYAGSPQNWVVV